MRTTTHTGGVVTHVSRLKFNGYAGAHTYRTIYPGGRSVTGVTHLGHRFLGTGLTSWSVMSLGARGFSLYVFASTERFSRGPFALRLLDMDS